jgi:hypothetical protein
MMLSGSLGGTRQLSAQRSSARFQVRTPCRVSRPTLQSGAGCGMVAAAAVLGVDSTAAWVKT